MWGVNCVCACVGTSAMIIMTLENTFNPVNKATKYVYTCVYV